MSKPSRGSQRVAAATALAFSLFAGKLAAEGTQPGVPVRLTRARPATRFELPPQPSVVWQARLLEPLLGAPVAADDGSLVVAHASGVVVALDRRGRVLRTVRAGSNLAFGPLLLQSGRRLVVTGDAEAVVLLPSGRIESRQKLSFRELDASATGISTSDGGALLAAGARFARLGPNGALTARGSVAETLRAVFEWRSESLFVERGGRVLALDHAGDPYELAHFSRSVAACELAGDRLFALVGERELVELTLPTRAFRTLWADPPLVPRELVVLANGEVRFVASGLLVALDTNGREAFRVQQPGASSEATSELFADARGSLLVATGALDLKLVTESGELVEIPGTACPDPLRPTPVSAGLVVASCRSGLLFGISGRAR